MENIWDNLGKTVKLNSLTDWPMNPRKARIYKMIRPEFRKKAYKQMTTIYASAQSTTSMIEELLMATE
jgi:hypothetical protein